jgi:outer membrane protein TolC
MALLPAPAAGQAMSRQATSAGSSPVSGIPRVTLRGAIERSVARNPSLALAREDIARSEALVRQALAGSLPTLTGNVIYTRLDNDRLFGEGTPAQRVTAGADSLSANVQLAVPLIYAQRWAQWSHTRDNLLSTRATSADVRRQVAAVAGRSYLVTLAQHRVIDVSVRALDTAREHRAFAEKRYAGGAGNRLDVVRAAQEAATTEAQLLGARASLARAQEALGVIMGAEGPVDAVYEADLGVPPDLQGALDALPLRRSDLRALDLRREAAQKVVRDNWTDYVPYLLGTFQPFYQNPASLMLPTTGWQAQLILSLPLYDGGLRYGQQRERRALLASAQVSVEAALRQARADVRAAYAVLREADQALLAAREAARLGEEAHAMASRAYEAGATTSLEVIDAARRARDAETAAVVAEDNARQARLDLLITSGQFP